MISSKSAVFLCVLTLITSVKVSAQHSLTKLWETEPTLSVPESVLFDAKAKLLYVSLIDGKAGEKDGKGGLAKVGTDGKIIDGGWITGLNAPKGLGKIGNLLYVADLDEVVIVNIAEGNVVQKIKVEGSSFLNDITIAQNGDIYVSDSNAAKVFLIKNNVASEYFKTPQRPNGLLSVKDGLLILDSGVLYKLDKSKNLQKLAEGFEKSTDGIEQVKPGEYIVSTWIGVVYYVNSKGEVQQLLDTRAESSNTADIGYDAAKKIVYVPTFNKNSVAAYQLK